MSDVDFQDPTLPDKAYERARAYLLEGWNCSQSVFKAMQELLGLEDKLALRAATGFAGGIGNSGAFCGACAGGVLTLSVLYGRDDLSQHQEKEDTYLYCAEWFRRFMKHFKSCQCREILGVDLNDPETRKEYWAKGRNRENCSELRVGTAARMVTQLIREIESDEGPTWTPREVVDV